MHINKISVNTNFGVKFTDYARSVLKGKGFTEDSINNFSCQDPTDATICAEGDNVYIEGKYARIPVNKSEQLSPESIKKLCEAYNIEKFFSSLENEKKQGF